jgi:hypothetical protein
MRFEPRISGVDQLATVFRPQEYMRPNRVLSTMPEAKNKQVEKPFGGIVDKTG